MAQYESYRGQGNPSPYNTAGNPYDDDTSYGGNPYSQGQYDQQGYEMNAMNSSDPNRILNECTQINSLVDALEARQTHLGQMRAAYIDDVVASTETGTGKAVATEADALLADYRNLVQRTKRVKSDRDSGSPRNAPQVGKLDRRVKSSMNKLQQADSDYRKSLQERMARDYRIVRPDASDAEVREATQDPSQQVFSQALINSDRRGQAQSTATAVRDRHNAISKIEQDMVSLAAMFQDLDALVVQQEAQVTSIEQRGEEVNDNVTKGNVELGGAVEKARAARKKKWICFGIGVAIVAVIVIVVVVAVVVTKK